MTGRHILLQATENTPKETTEVFMLQMFIFMIRK